MFQETPIAKAKLQKSASDAKIHAFGSRLLAVTLQVFLKENVRYPVWTCRDPISLILGARFYLILGTR